MSPFPSEAVTVLGIEVSALRGEFGDEYRALTESAALLPMPWDVSLQVVGKDAGPFLQNLLTQDILALQLGGSIPAALASRRGHLQADLQVSRDADGFRLRLQRRLLQSFTETLDRYRIVEDVQWSLEPEDQTSFLLAGPHAEAIWNGLSLSGGTHGVIVEEISEADMFITVSSRTAPDLVRTIEGATPDGVQMIGWRAFNVARIEAGRAWFGIDADEERLVPEPGFANRISYEKGCYLGQETIARLHYRGKLNWELQSLQFDSELSAATGARAGESLLSEGARVGWLTSVEVRPDGTGVALGYLHRKFRESPGTLSLSNGLPVSCGSTLTCRVDSPKVSDESLDPHPGTG